MKLLLTIALFAVLAAGCSGGNVTFTVRNVGNEPLVECVVHVTGNSYRIGDLSPGQTKSFAVRPKGESHIEIEQAGHPRLLIDCYIEPGYKGEIAADVTTAGVVSVWDRVEL